jgi:RNA polymerase sigma-70 factor (ECF subfamily)
MPMGEEQEPVMLWRELQKSDDTELVRQLAAGNHDALAVIVDRYERLVLSVARRIVKDECEAEDVVQTVFLEVFKNPAQFDPRRGTLKVWLLQFAYSRSINQRSHLERRRFYGNVGLTEAEPLAPPELGRFRLSSGETSRLVRQAMGLLDGKQERAIALLYFEGLTAEEAAARTGETAAAVRHHYYRGLMKLREFVQSGKAVRQKHSTDEHAMGFEVADADPRAI